jgi:hypothetical protein
MDGIEDDLLWDTDEGRTWRSLCLGWRMWWFHRILNILVSDLFYFIMVLVYNFKVAFSLYLSYKTTLRFWRAFFMIQLSSYLRKYMVYEELSAGQSSGKKKVRTKRQCTITSALTWITKFPDYMNIAVPQ